MMQMVLNVSPMKKSLQNWPEWAMRSYPPNQWKFLIHTILQCMSAKRTSWNEFSSSMASAIICLSSGDLSTHTTKYTSPALTQKVFANMRRVGSDQIQIPQYPDVHPPSNEISDEAFHAKEDLMKSIQTFLEEFNCIPFEEKPQILLEAWFKFFAIKRAQPENSNELFQKLFEDLKELTEYKESLENSSKEIAVSNSNKEKEDLPQDSDIRKLIREECCVEVSAEQKLKMDDTILELVKICR
nr:hypothetical protein [Tanacetum cinerariifolium]